MATFIKECYLQKSLHYQVLDAFANEATPLEQGKPIMLSSEIDDDGKLVVVASAGDFKVGILADEDAKDVKPYIIAHWINDRLYECKVYKKDETASENKMLSIAIYVKEYPNE